MDLLASWFGPRTTGEPARLQVGTMNFGWRAPAAECERIVAHALDHGLCFFDTANVYGEGESERILGKALQGRREQAIVATKAGIGKLGQPEGLSRARVLAAADESLARLGTDWVDVFYLHAPDYRTPIAETLDAIATLVRAGKVRAFAVSNYASWQILEIERLCRDIGITPPVMSQVLYNLLVRQLDVEYFRYTRAHPIHTVVFNALAGGLLSGRYQRGMEIPPNTRFHGNRMYQRRYWTTRAFDAIEGYSEIAREHGLTLLELAYAWLQGHPDIGSVLIGPTSVEQLAAVALKPLSPAVRARIDALHVELQGTDACYAR